MEKITNRDISIGVKVAYAVITAAISAIVAIGSIAYTGGQTTNDIETIKATVKDTITRTQDDHDKIIRIESNISNLKENFESFKMQYQSDSKEIKEMLRKMKPE